MEARKCVKLEEAEDVVAGADEGGKLNMRIVPLTLATRICDCRRGALFSIGIVTREHILRLDLRRPEKEEAVQTLGW